jgi:hypothetical protein
MRVRYQFVALCATVLPAIPVVMCLVMRGVEAWKLWYDMRDFTFLGAIAWVWVASYLLASVVTILHIDDAHALKWWEFFIDAGNIVASIILAIKCASHQVDDGHPVPYLFRFFLWFSVCVIPQLMVTHAARRARAVARRLHKQLKIQQAKVAAKTAVGIPSVINATSSVATNHENATLAEENVSA